MTCTLMPGLDLLTSFLETHPVQTHNPTYLLLPSNSAVGKALNASPHEEQETAIQHLNKLGKLITSYPNLNIKLLWLLKAGPFCHAFFCLLYDMTGLDSRLLILTIYRLRDTMTKHDVAAQDDS
jgi:hypothetical protein